MKHVPLSRGMVAFVDDADFSVVSGTDVSARFECTGCRWEMSEEEAKRRGIQEGWLAAHIHAANKGPCRGVWKRIEVPDPLCTCGGVFGVLFDTCPAHGAAPKS